MLTSTREQQEMLRICSQRELELINSKLRIALETILYNETVLCHVEAFFLTL